MPYYVIAVFQPKMLRAILVLLLICPAVALSAHITDKLLAGMYDAPSSEQSPIKLLPSGTPIELIGEKNGFINVQLVDGKTGWVEKRFLSDDKPAKVRLLALQSKYRKLQAKLDLTEERLLESNKAKEPQVALPPAALAESSKSQQQDLVSAESTEEALPEVQAEISLPEKALIEDGEGSYMTVFLVLLSLILFLVLGVVIGVWLQDQRQLKRHGGFRI